LSSCAACHCSSTRSGNADTLPLLTTPGATRSIAPISAFEIVVPAAGIRLTSGLPLAIGELLSVSVN
jgi:hypothetical protein